MLDDVLKSQKMSDRLSGSQVVEHLTLKCSGEADREEDKIYLEDNDYNFRSTRFGDSQLLAD